jgi:hypothetical protein
VISIKFSLGAGIQIVRPIQILKNAVFCDVFRVGLVRTDVSDERVASLIRVKRISELGTRLAVILRSVLQLLVTLKFLARWLFSP